MAGRLRRAASAPRFVLTITTIGGLTPGHEVGGYFEQWGLPGPGKWLTTGALGAYSGPTGHVMMGRRNLLRVWWSIGTGAAHRCGLVVPVHLLSPSGWTCDGRPYRRAGPSANPRGAAQLQAGNLSPLFKYQPDLIGNSLFTKANFARGGLLPGFAAGGVSGHPTGLQGSQSNAEAWKWIHGVNPSLSKKQLGQALAGLDRESQRLVADGRFGAHYQGGGEPPRLVPQDHRHHRSAHPGTRAIRVADVGFEGTNRDQSRKLLGLDRSAVAWLLRAVHDLDRMKGPLDDRISAHGTSKSDVKAYQHQRSRLDSEMKTLVGLSGIGGMLATQRSRCSSFSRPARASRRSRTFWRCFSSVTRISLSSF